MFAEEQIARAYSGRGGLGLGAPSTAPPPVKVYTSSSWATASVGAVSECSRHSKEEDKNDKSKRKAEKKAARKAKKEEKKGVRKAKKASEEGKLVGKPSKKRSSGDEVTRVKKKSKK